MQKIELKSHAVIVEIPRGYGFEFALKSVEFSGADVFKLAPSLHGSQKTEIINTEDISEIQQKVRVKSNKKQVFAFLDAEKMTHSAQSKFLKTLEEPHSDLVFILVVNSAENLLNTVRSRCQIFRLPVISKLDSLKILKKHKLDEVKARQILFLAEGLPEEITKLASDKKYFEQRVTQIELAKKWFSRSKFDRIEIIAQIKNDRQLALGFIELCLKIARVKFSPETSQQLTPEISKLLNAHDRILRNQQVRLSLMGAIL